MTRTNTRATVLVATALLIGMGAVTRVGGPAEVVQAQGAANAGGLEVQQIRPNFYLIAGAGGNIGVQIGPDGPLVIDSGTLASAPAVVAAIKALSPRPIRFVINTGPDAEHVGGNEIVAKAGETIFGTVVYAGGASYWTNGGAASIVAHEHVLARMSAPTGKSAVFPVAAWPTDSFFEPRHPMYFNDEGIEIFYLPSAHTDGDSAVLFRKSDVVMAGDIIDYTRFPVIDTARGGSVQGEVDALNRIIDMAIAPMPYYTREDSTRIIPGHGRPLQQVEVVDYRDMVTIITDRIQGMIDKKMTLDQIKAANPALGWVKRWGSDSGPWTTNMFIEAIYTSLMKGVKK